jgi:gas vesicle protein
MCKEKEHENLFSGMMLGGLVGIALGILFAPLAGERTRSKIKEKLEEFDFDDILNRFSEAFQAGKEEALKVAREEEE